MNKYILIDLENLQLSHLEKVETEFEENERYTGSEMFESEIALFNATLDDIKDTIRAISEKNDLPICSECGHIMEDGFVIGDGEEHYCNENCLYKHYTEEEYNRLYEEDEEANYWTTWY